MAKQLKKASKACKYWNRGKSSQRTLSSEQLSVNSGAFNKFRLVVET